MKLKPCPFCGSRRIILRTNGTVDDGILDYKTVCENCYVSGQWYDSSDDAIEAWNTRADKEDES